jgi:flagellar motor switch protein FliN
MANGIIEAKDLEILKQTFMQSLKQTAAVLSTILKCKTQIAAEQVTLVSQNDISSTYTETQAVVRIQITNEVQGQGFMVLPQTLAAVLSNILTGKKDKSAVAQLGAAELSVLNQVIAQFLNSLSASLTQSVGRRLNMASNEIKLSSLAAEIASVSSFSQAVLVTIRISLESITDELCFIAFPLNIASELITKSGGKSMQTGQKIEPLNLAPLDKSQAPVGTGVSSILADIPLQLTVELGRTKMLLKDILELGVGSIIELDQLAGEPVDIILNNKSLAKGEVVVIDENIGVRLTHIINPSERI